MLRYVSYGCSSSLTPWLPAILGAKLSLSYPPKTVQFLPSSSPGKIFIHSADSGKALFAINRIGKLQERVLSYELLEWKDIQFHPSSDARTTVFRGHLNRVHGFNFPLTEAQVRLIANPDAKIDLCTAHSDMREGNLTCEEAISLIDASSLSEDFSPTIDQDALDELGIDLYRNYPESGNFIGDTVSGYLAFNLEKAQALNNSGKKVILVLNEYAPEHIHSIGYAAGIILLNGESEHLGLIIANEGISAALDMDKSFPLRIQETGAKKSLVGQTNDVKPFSIDELQEVTIQNWGTQTITEPNGRYTTKAIGRILPFSLPTVEVGERNIDWIDFRIEFMERVDETLRNCGGMKVKANADSAKQVSRAVHMGASGIGLLRTEHMLFSEERLAALRVAVLADDAITRSPALKTLQNFYVQDFSDIFSAANTAGPDFPITIRLLDAPPDEFLTTSQAQQLSDRVGSENMRGTPLALRTPGLYEMQTRAIFEAARATNYVGQIEIMVPLVRSAAEVSAIKDVVSAIGQEYGMQGKYYFRSMLETVTAIEEAETIAALVDGVSFGTNDLTSESMGNIKRTDIAAIQNWMSRTNHKGKSPFLTISEPVLRLLQAATNVIRLVNPSVDISICGNQVAGDPSSISACNNLGLDSISVPASPLYFYPSKIMAAQAALQGKPLAGGIGNRQRGAGVIIQKFG